MHRLSSEGQFWLTDIAHACLFDPPSPSANKSFNGPRLLLSMILFFSPCRSHLRDWPGCKIQQRPRRYACMGGDWPESKTGLTGRASQMPLNPIEATKGDHLNVTSSPMTRPQFPTPSLLPTANRCVQLSCGWRPWFPKGKSSEGPCRVSQTLAHFESPTPVFEA